MSEALTRLPDDHAMERRATSPIDILEAAVRGGITAESVAVVKELAAMCREQRAEDAKIAFAKAFFQLRKNMPEFYADKTVTDNSGKVAFVYLSEEELSKIIEPHLLKHGFTTLMGQEEHDGKITVNLTLLHEAGHQEIRSFTVRALAPNRMIQGEKCDTGAATTAWRHLMIKLFGLKSRIHNEDARVEGDLTTFITPEQADSFEHRAQLLDCVKSFLAFAKASKFAEIPANRYDELEHLLSRKERKAQ